ncbi:hypothetical protein M430DRAFT_44833 [Amorphotheca resinae ATCC 22711]|uniref:Uncharacterized protein n=1 Tax=Amorphotheca resinae ATCC 22711 TaxID=857342 RepID=A0A2T3AT79_AMORE|nr:hypothetical protein M430DRAFT_44833 [Amorphotheca resinae ATCC 22711]PSS10686.1 hypothetical protein M430DRAFT_44833 [Amorphotheca resinae ATCC 22711]
MSVPYGSTIYKHLKRRALLRYGDEASEYNQGSAQSGSYYESQGPLAQSPLEQRPADPQTSQDDGATSYARS